MAKIFINTFLFILLFPLLLPAEDNLKELADGNREFAFKLYRKIGQREGNLFFSPYSISSALAITYAGASRETEKQMAEAICFRLGQEKLHIAFSEMDKRVKGIADSNDIAISVANGLWAQMNHPFLESFINIAKKNYSAEIRNADFIANPEEQRKEINSWVKEKTHDKIKELIGKGAINQATVLVLVNAIYFKGLWARQFKKENTKIGEFLVSPDKCVKVPMMMQVGEFACIDDGKLKVVEVPYKGSQISLFIIMPKDIGQFSDIVKNFSPQSFDIKTLWKGKVFLSLPKFTIESSAILNATLNEMGMKDAFDSSKADFSGMDAGQGLSISEVIHKAYIDVNEEGTEAAAATAVAVSKDGISPKIFRIDRPFIFYIMDNPTQNILFMGKVVNPDISKPLETPSESYASPEHRSWKK